ncbi:MAG: hypothetical protein Q7T73_09915 [Beijerinckiaceae bacterium]|nr:hypothetical protein [Beijerinckiaceae bacterium]
MNDTVRTLAPEDYRVLVDCVAHGQVVVSLHCDAPGEIGRILQMRELEKAGFLRQLPNTSAHATDRSYVITDAGRRQI